MFNRYWRTYPWYFQFLQLILLIAVLFFFFVVGIGFGVLPKLTGIPMDKVLGLSSTSPYAVVQLALVEQVLFSISLFLLPALLFAYTTHPRPGWYLGLRPPGRSVQWLAVAILMVGLMPILVQLSSWMSLLPWSAAARADQQKQEAMTKALIQMHSFGDLVKVFLVVAILPAFGEEMMFRGIFMKFAAKRTPGIGFPIFISALMFAFLHDNSYGFLSIFMAGAMLGLIYYWTGSLWCSILGHCINNGLQVGLLYLGNYNKQVEQIFGQDNIPLWMFLCGIALTALGLYLLWKNRTPLPPDWTADYSEEEQKEQFDI